MLRQERKQRSRLKGGTTRSRSNCSPLKNPPGGTIGRLTLRFGSGGGFQPLPPFWVVVFGALRSHAVDWKIEKNQYRTIERYRAQKGSLVKGSWHAVGVTEGFTAGTFPKAQSYVKRQKPIAPSGRELSPQVTEGASGRQADCLQMGWYLLEIVDAQSCTAVTIPGTKRLPCQRELARRSRD